MALLVPAPSDLHLHSPALGPWFDPVGVDLPAPADGELAVPLTLGSGGTQLWLPPAAGILSFFISAATRPAGIADLRDPTGAAAFADDRLIARFRLLPEVEERLAALSRLVPTLAGGVATGTGRTRPRVRTFALEFTAASPNWAFLNGVLYENFPFPPNVDTDAKKAEHVGLRLQGGVLVSGARPMVDLIAPGKFAGKFAQLMRFTSATQARLWIFDDRGLPIEPGAVASWWRYLTTANADVDGYTNLWAEGIDGADRRTAPLASGAQDRLTVHLVNAHGGALTSEAMARVSATNLTGDGAVRVRGGDAAAAQLSLTAAPATDDLPDPRIALLPDGRMDATLSIWPSGPIDSGSASPILTRDFARVMVRSLEHDLVGQPRHADGGAAAIVQRRAADQNRASTGLRVGRAVRGGLKATTEEAAQAVLDVVAVAGVTRIVTGVLDRDYGVRSFTAPAGDPPGADARPDITVTALVGGSGTLVDTVVIGQRALVTLTFAAGAALAGAWVRVWTQGFDHDKAEHVRLEGGAGMVDGTGKVRLVALLPDGAADPDALMGLEAMIITQGGARLYSDLRFDRPNPAAGAMASLGSLPGGTPVLVCDTGAVLTTPISDALPSGASLVANPDSSATLVDRATIPDAAFATTTLVRGLAAGDVISLTQPAFRGQPDGDAVAAFSGTGATVTRVVRSASPWSAGNPLPAMERLETVAVNAGATRTIGAVAPSPALARHHELLPHRQGHPGCPGTEDAHGAGVLVDGPAAIGLAEYVRDRTAASTSALATAADTPLQVPSAPASDSLWAVGLRTEAAGVALEVGLDTLLASVTSSSYNFDDTWANKRTWLNNHVDPDIPNTVGQGANEASVVRAVDRRVLTSSFGAREAATSLRAAFARAERLVYLETPALDGLELGATNDKIDLWAALVDRVAARPGLHVVICLPYLLGRGTPVYLQRIRDAVVTEALAELAGNPRVAVFHPAAGPQRSLLLHSTAVVVDDVYALVGTSHLWRRGLSFDSSYAVALTDDRLEDDRAQEIAAFRRSLCAGRLGLALPELPDDPAELAFGLRLLASRGGHGRLAAKRIAPPDPDPALAGLIGSSSMTSFDIWDRDGSPESGFNPVAWLANLTTTVNSGAFNP